LLTAARFPPSRALRLRCWFTLTLCAGIAEALD
jgi:hypothetical protein